MAAGANNPGADTVASWKAWHRELVEILGGAVVERQATLELAEAIMIENEALWRTGSVRQIAKQRIDRAEAELAALKQRGNH